MSVVSKVVLPRRVIKQPVPHINQEGDCGACVLGGFLNREGDPGQVVAGIYKEYTKDIPTIGHGAMESALFEARAQGYVEEFISDTPMWSIPETQNQFGATSRAVSLQWFAYIKMAIRAGYYGLAMINAIGKGTHAFSTDHWVMICGFRTRLVAHKRIEGAGTYVNEILISNSSNKAKDERWIEINKFLLRYGGYNAILVLPTEDK